MNRICQRISIFYCAQNECTNSARLTFSRSLSASARRCDSAEEKKEEGNGKTPQSSQDKPASAANSLLSTLAGLKVERSLSSKVGRSPRLRSAAADFRDLLSPKKAKDEDGSNVRARRPEDVQKMVVETAKVVAEIFPEKEVVESDLLKQLRRHDKATAAGQKGDVEAVSSVLSGIKVEKQTALQKERDRRTSHDERALAGTLGTDFEAIGEMGQDDAVEDKRKHKPVQRQQKRTLYDRHRLHIFMPASEDTSETQVAEVEHTVPSLWDKEEAKQLKKLAYSTTNSGFDEMARWTEEGKMWCYPVDNEQGMEEEQEVPFHEHVFLDHLLEDLPPLEPIQTFMELVCLGLSQNPYLTVQQKHDHIHWFKSYFKEKEAVIREAMQADRGDEAEEIAT